MLNVQTVQGAFNLVKAPCGDMGIYFSGLAAFVAQQALYIPQISATFQQMGSKTMPERMYRYFFLYAATLR